MPVSPSAEDGASTTEGTVAIDAVVTARRALFEAQVEDLERLAAATRLRKLSPRSGRDFSSNDYLGLASSGAMAGAVRAALERGVPVGSGGSRLLRGNHEEHEKLEQEAADFFGSESALFFSSGYAANSALFSTLPQRGDLVVHDALIHASAHEGLRLSRADHVSARHNDAGHVEKLATDWRARGGRGRLWIAVESLYSMDGDRAPLSDLLVIAGRHDAILVVDEAHATGVLGRGGRGLAGDLEGSDNVITLRTCGKALGCEGALVCGPQAVKDFLVNRGRGFIFSTAPSPLMAAVVRSALRIVEDGSELRSRLWARVGRAGLLAGRLGHDPTGSQILPIVLGGDARAMDVAEALQEAGFDVRGIRPPTVPAETARLRISITLNPSDADVEALFSLLSAIL